MYAYARTSRLAVFTVCSSPSATISSRFLQLLAKLCTNVANYQNVSDKPISDAFFATYQLFAFVA